MEVLVCGGRNYDDLGAVWGYLDALHNMSGPVDVVIHGGARGADLLADKWAVYNNVRRLEFLPNWQEHGRAAGPIRNRRMLEEAKPDLVAASPGGRGTADMIFQAKEFGVPVEQVS